jgi:signal transduction histidine kinase
MRTAHAGIGRRALVIDGLVACAALAVAELEVASGSLGAGAAALAAAASLALAGRRRVPLASFAVVAVVVPALDAVAGSPWGDDANAPVFLIMVSAYSVGAHASARRSAAAVAGAAAAFALMEAASGGSDYFFLAFLLALPWLAGVGIGRHREQTVRLDALARRLEQERAISEQVAVARERQRMAYETGDGIGHAVSEMALQAAGAQEVLDRDPERARRALVAIQDTGREAVAQLRGALGMVRAGEPPAGVGQDGVPRMRRGAWRAWPAALDAPLALALLGLGAGVVLTNGAFAGQRAAALGIQAVAALALALHHRRPWTALALALAAWTAETALLGADPVSPVPALAVVAVTYSVAARTRGWAAAAVALGALGTPLLGGLVLAGDDAADVLLPTALVSVPLTAGLVVSAQRRRSDRLARLAEQLRRERDARARLAALEERGRMARELHDSIAHAVSVMVLQAGAAEAVLDERPEQARRALSAVQDVARDALRDLGALLGVLAPDAGPAPLAPTPGLAWVPQLVDTVRRAGLPVRLLMEGTPAALPAPVEQAAYRILQEALTNALKHSGRSTRVTVRHSEGGVELEVVSAGATSSSPEPGGHGLAGMRERAAGHGGSFTAGPTADGLGFVVRAVLPATPVGVPA